MSKSQSFPKLTADEAAQLINHDSMVAFSGFTPAAHAKAVPLALAERARALHHNGQPFQIRVLTGASTGRSLDDALAEADAISWRAPYQSSAPLRKRINDGHVDFVDMHLSHVPQSVLFGFFGKIDFAVIEASRVTSDGRVYLTNSIGASPTFLQAADKVIIELNRSASAKISEMADIVIPKPPPYRPALDLDFPLQRIGKTFARVDPEKIVGIVETNQLDELTDFARPTRPATPSPGMWSIFSCRKWPAAGSRRKCSRSKRAWEMLPMPSSPGWECIPTFPSSSCTPRCFSQPPLSS